MRKYFLILCALSFASCASMRHPGLYPLPGAYAYRIPRSADDGLPVAGADTFFSAEKMTALDALFSKLKEGAFGEIHSVLMAYRGRLIVEEYFPGYRFHGAFREFSEGDLHHLASVTKSITSLCIGIAADKGLIRDIDAPFLDYYREEAVPDREEKQGITLRHLLTMTAGLKWDERTFPYTDSRNDVVRLYKNPDPLAFCLSRPPAAAPGMRWVYSGAYPNLLGDVIRRASGLGLDAFARQYLYEPMGISRSSWITLRKGFIYASGDAELRPRDMLKIGIMVSNRGEWMGKRIVSEEWIEESMKPAAKTDGSSRYGFMWWLPELSASLEKTLGPVWMADGWGDQYIVIAPRSELVIVVTGGNYEPPLPGQTQILSYMTNELFSE